ncbi:hypothetical protein NLU13_3817 [Sarocladium strictum]|uniref:Zn(2)-C6 fungal-type domain-containing protein n=1 Tax=Sarocladium strictum TaxID=5046 RepID=A0AA39L7M8_SARSR|nr:hypothetical protein NLU13_3817 [Sarocladium strictum]
MRPSKRPRLQDEGSRPERTGVNHDGAMRPRLTRACAECKRHKIKCYIQPGEESCNKCLKSGISCEPYNFAQKFIDDDAAWKAEATSTIKQLQDAVKSLLEQSGLPDLPRINGSSSVVHMADKDRRKSIQTLSPLTTDHSASVKLAAGNFTSEGPTAGTRSVQDDSDLVPLPMNNLYNLTDPNNSRLIRVDPSDVNGPDLIEQGIVSLADAESLFSHYRDHINPLLWDGILCSHKTLTDVRQSSSLLVTVVLTVAALHIPNCEQLLHATYGAFVSLMRGSCLLRCSNLDVIRALCIGAFYLTSLSWALCSRAVRVGTEMNLHKSSLQFARGSSESYERVRLWFALYLCDHQFSLAYGRPPLMHEDAAIRNAEKLLSSGLSSKGDDGLVAQVKLFRILASGYFMHGCDADLELAAEDYKKLQNFNISVDRWRLEYSATPPDDAPDSSIPSSANALYYHLARFQLNSVALRGISSDGVSRDTPKLEMDLERQEAANIAITSAMSAARLIIDDKPLQSALIGLPIFTHAMIAVCASFLLKMAVVFGNAGASEDRATLRIPRDLAHYGLHFNTKASLSTVERLVGVLSNVADGASQRHVARQVVTGIRELLQRFSPSGQADDHFVYSVNPGREESVGAADQDKGPWLSTKGSSAAQGDSGSHNGAVGIGGPQFSESLVNDPAAAAQQDFFDLTGDLDWRFDDGFLLGIDSFDSDVPFL